MDDKLEGIIHAIHHLKAAFDNAGLEQPSIQLNGYDDIWKLSTMSTDVLLKQRSGDETRINGVLVLPAPVRKAEQWPPERIRLMDQEGLPPAAPNRLPRYSR